MNVDDPRTVGARARMIRRRRALLDVGRRHARRRSTTGAGCRRSARTGVVRNDPLARELVLTLDHRARHRVWELDSLRNRFGIGGHGSRNANN
jgi:hypothetical protein